jgi:hypothetical protein
MSRPLRASIPLLALLACVSWRSDRPQTPPRLVDFTAGDSTALPLAECPLAAFAIRVEPDGSVRPDGVRLVALLPPGADPVQVERMRQLVSTSRWEPGADVAGHGMAAWAEVHVNCQGHTAQVGPGGGPGLAGAEGQQLERLRRESQTARREAAGHLARSAPRDTLAPASLWDLDAVRADLATFQRRRPFFFDDILGGKLPSGVREAAGDLWIVRRADSDHHGMFVFLDPQHRVLGSSRYIVGE